MNYKIIHFIRQPFQILGFNKKTISTTLFMKKIILLLVAFMCFINMSSAQNPTYLCKISGAQQVSCNAYEFNVTLQRTGTTVFKLAMFQLGIMVNPAIIPAGAHIVASPVSGNSWLSNSSQIPNQQHFSYDSINNCIRVSPVTPPGYLSASIIPDSTNGIRLCRIRVTCSQGFNTGVSTAHAWSFSLATGYETKIFAYVGPTDTDITVQASHILSGTSNTFFNDLSQLNNMWPNHSYAGSNLTSTITGYFNNVTGVKLSRPSWPDINLPYSLNSGISCGNAITSIFTLPNNIHGLYNLEVTTTDTNMVLPNAFLIDTVPVGCHTYFTTSYNPTNDTLKLFGHANYLDSTQIINVISWNWTIHVGALTYTLNSQNDRIHLDGLNGNAYVCLTINTSTSCQSSFCDSVILASPPTFCNTGFYFHIDTLYHNIAFVDNSYTNSGSFNSWAWGISLNCTQLFTSNLQNPVFNFSVNGIYHVCLSTTTDSGCVAQNCYNIYVPDTVYISPNNCVAAFTYQLNSIDTTVQLFDQSTSSLGTINSWYWTFSQNGVFLDSSVLQNPVFSFQSSGYYEICLVVSMNASCSANICHLIYLNDSNSNACQLTVNSNVSHVSVINGSDGTIDLTVSGGTAPYTYAWNTGATTQDIYNLSTGIYTVAISSVPACPSYTYNFAILQPFDSNNIIVDTLYSPVIDSCLNFVIDSFYIANITVQGNTVTVQWVLIGGGAMATLNTTYTYSNFGSQVVILSVSCGSKDIAKYTSYIYISQAYSLNENSFDPEINLYPNPVTDFLNITFGNLISNSMVLKIFNTAGQQVYERSVSGKTNQIGINVSEFRSGVYFVKFDAGIGKPIVKKFLK
jgi:PKD repeat protein